MLLPSLNDGITLLDVDVSRDIPLLQSIVLDHLLMNGGSAFWVDANGHATTTTLSRIVTSQRLLDSLQDAITRLHAGTVPSPLGWDRTDIQQELSETRETKLTDFQ
nr:hypothetical protein [Haloarcula sp. 1CSR25-25]